MSESFEMLVDVDAPLSEADRTARRVLHRFRKLGLIIGRATADCVLGGSGYRPGPAVVDSYKLARHECRYWELVTCGVEPKVGRSFNEWALGPSCEGLSCSACGSDIELSADVFWDRFGKAIDEWSDESGPALVS